MAQELAARGASDADATSMRHGLGRCAAEPRPSSSVASDAEEEDGWGGEGSGLGGSLALVGGSLALSTSLQAMMRAKERHDGRQVRPALALPCPSLRQALTAVG